MSGPETFLDGFQMLPGYFDRTAQSALLADIQAALTAAPFYKPVMPRSGRPFSVSMSNCGPLGWVSDRAGYRYQDHHPETSEPWPAIPQRLLDLWRDVSGVDIDPDACLINLYQGKARMGAHQDRDEETFDAPVVSVSLGDTAMFRIGGLNRKDPTRSVRLASGDVVVLGGESRLAFHGIDRVIPETSTLVPDGGRINLTLRRVKPWPSDG